LPARPSRGQGSIAALGGVLKGVSGGSKSSRTRYHVAWTRFALVGKTPLDHISNEQDAPRPTRHARTPGFGMRRECGVDAVGLEEIEAAEDFW
jgi:hypothetical protein